MELQPLDTSVVQPQLLIFRNLMYVGNGGDGDTSGFNSLTAIYSGDVDNQPI